MTFGEKKLYHQIHPLKLGTDISTSIISLYLLWYHYLHFGIVLHYLLPILASIFVISCFDLDDQRNSPLGRYIKKYMSSWMEGTRLGGDAVTLVGAWQHNWFVILFGFLIIIAAWLRGKISI